jgi:Reverse transcriptase (RNA-dependent DNA polymerase)
MLESVVLTNYIYPSLRSPPNLSFSDQPSNPLHLRPQLSFISSIHITDLLETNSYVIVYVLDFSKGFNSVWHSAILDKYLQLKLPDNIYHWIELFFRDHSH